VAGLTSQEISLLFLELGILLAVARLLGELAEHYNQPTVLGEIIAGILLGPTILGSIAPEINLLLFPLSGNRAIVLEGLTTIAIALFLLVAGMEVDLSTIWKQGKVATNVGIMGILIPFIVSFPAGMLFPTILGRQSEANPFIFSFFFGIALSITALPVIARILMDLNLYRSDFGMIVIASAIFNDVIGWILFAAVLGMIGTAPAHNFAVGQIILMTLGFGVIMLTIGRWLINKILPAIHAHLSWPGGFLGFALAVTLFCSALTEWIGTHAIFGAFLAGIAIGDSPHVREHTRTILNQFISFIFAPLFFASIGLKVNFAIHFDLSAVITVLIIACLAKIVGCGLGARMSGMTRRESLAMGFSMNARGAMEIILGLLALQYGLIKEKMFIALVIMALVTSIMCGPAIKYILKPVKPRRFIDFLLSRTFIGSLRAKNREEAIEELSNVISTELGIGAESIKKEVWEREKIMPTGIGHSVAIPHARIDGLTTPILGVGLSRLGIDFDAPDGEPAGIIFMILTPKQDNGAQLEILADISRTFRFPDIREKALKAINYTEFKAVIKSKTTL